jgi:hypothetical protein
MGPVEPGSASRRLDQLLSISEAHGLGSYGITAATPLPLSALTSASVLRQYLPSPL